MAKKKKGKGKGKAKKAAAPKKTLLETIGVTQTEIKSACDPFAFVQQQLSNKISQSKPYNWDDVIDKAISHAKAEDQRLIIESRRPKPYGSTNTPGIKPAKQPDDDTGITRLHARMTTVPAPPKPHVKKDTPRNATIQEGWDYLQANMPRPPAVIPCDLDHFHQKAKKKKPRMSYIDRAEHRQQIRRRNIAQRQKRRNQRVPLPLPDISKLTKVKEEGDSRISNNSKRDDDASDDHGIRVLASLRAHPEIGKIEFHCGSGDQTISWLGTAVIERILQTSTPHGAVGSRSHVAPVSLLRKHQRQFLLQEQHKRYLAAQRKHSRINLYDSEAHKGPTKEELAFEREKEHFVQGEVRMKTERRRMWAGSGTGAAGTGNGHFVLPAKVCRVEPEWEVDEEGYQVPAEIVPQKVVLRTIHPKDKIRDVLRDGEEIVVYIPSSATAPVDLRARAVHRDLLREECGLAPYSDSELLALDPSDPFDRHAVYHSQYYPHPRNTHTDGDTWLPQQEVQDDGQPHVSSWHEAAFGKTSRTSPSGITHGKLMALPPPPRPPNLPRRSPKVETADGGSSAAGNLEFGKDAGDSMQFGATGDSTQSGEGSEGVMKLAVDNMSEGQVMLESAKFKLLMSDTLMDDDEREEEVQLLLEDDFRNIMILAKHSKHTGGDVKNDTLENNTPGGAKSKDVTAYGWFENGGDVTTVGKRHEKLQCKMVLSKYYDILERGFKYYSASENSLHGTASMSLVEFELVMSSTGMFGKHGRGALLSNEVLKSTLGNVFKEVLEASKVCGLVSPKTKELNRYQFIAAIMLFGVTPVAKQELHKYIDTKRAELKANKHDNGAAVGRDDSVELDVAKMDFNSDFTHHCLRVMLDAFVVPSFQDRVGGDDEIRKQLMHRNVQATIMTHSVKLLDVYRYYAAKIHSGEARPTMDLTEFMLLMKDSGMLSLSVSDTKSSSSSAAAGAILSETDVRTAFTRAQHQTAEDLEDDENRDDDSENGDTKDDAVSGDQKGLSAKIKNLPPAIVTADENATHSNLEELVFPEFLDALARVAACKWSKQTDLSFLMKLEMALQAICALHPHIKDELKEQAALWAGHDAELAGAGSASNSRRIHSNSKGRSEHHAHRPRTTNQALGQGDVGDLKLLSVRTSSTGSGAVNSRVKVRNNAGSKGIKVFEVRSGGGEAREQLHAQEQSQWGLMLKEDGTPKQDGTPSSPEETLDSIPAWKRRKLRRVVGRDRASILVRERKLVNAFTVQLASMKLAGKMKANLRSSGLKDKKVSSSNNQKARPQRRLPAD